MKISDNHYYCDWCGENIHETVARVTGHGKHSTPSQLRCPKCFRYVSQKTKLERDKK